MISLIDQRLVDESGGVTRFVKVSRFWIRVKHNIWSVPRSFNRRRSRSGLIRENWAWKNTQFTLTRCAPQV